MKVLTFVLLLIAVVVLAQKQKKHGQEVKKRSSERSKKQQDNSFFDDFLKEEKDKGINRINTESEKSIKAENEKEGSGQSIKKNGESCPQCAVSQHQAKYALQQYWMLKLDNSYACACQVLTTSPSSTDEMLKALFLSLKGQRHYIPQFDATIKIPALADPKPILRDWEILGPFPVGKMEVDGDPTFQSFKYDDYEDFASYLLSMSSNAVRYSELLSEGKVSWRRLQSGASGQTDVHFSALWQELGQGLSTNAVYEYQAWARTYTYVKAAGSYLLECQGPHTAYVRNDNITRIVVGDVYRAQQIRSSLDLKAGLVGIIIPIRAVVQTQFACTLQPANNQIIVYPPTMIPQVIELPENPGKGLLLSSVFALTVHNTFSQTINLEFTLENPIGEDTNFFVRTARPLPASSSPSTEEFNSLNIIYSVAAGQTMSLALELVASGQSKNKKSSAGSSSTPTSSSQVFIGCRENRIFQLIINPSKGNGLKVPLDLACRKIDQSFLYSFLDHDGSVAQAAIILPLNYHTPNHKILGKRAISNQKQADVNSNPLPNEFPVLLTLHGSGIQPLNHADAHKMMPLNAKQYLFGIENYYIIAPSRFGAHNWEGVGDLTARTSIQSIQQSIQLTKGLLPNITLQHSILAGHSMGGHGAWITSTNTPNVFQCIMPLASWIKKEEYATSNLFLALDISNSFINILLKHIIERCLYEYHIDHMIDNLITSNIYLRVGSHDFTTYPWFTRRMYRLLKQKQMNVTIEEVFGKQHWWWDTAVDNDGGVVNDVKIREFYSSCHSQYTIQRQLQNYYYSHYLPLLPSTTSSPSSSSSSTNNSSFYHYIKTNASKEIMKELPNAHEEALKHRCERGDITLTLMNPALHEGFCGVQIIHQHQILLKSSITITCRHLSSSSLKECHVRTSNVKRFTLSLDYGSSLFEAKRILINEQLFDFSERSDLKHICIGEQNHQVSLCLSPFLHPLREKTLITYGPIRRVYDRPFLIVYGTPTDQGLRITMKDLAIYLANSHYTSHYTSVQVLSDLEYLTGNYLKRLYLHNIIFIGDHTTNKVVKSALNEKKSSKDTSNNNGYSLTASLPSGVVLYGFETESDEEDKDIEVTMNGESKGILSSRKKLGFQLHNALFDKPDHGIIFTLPLLRENTRAISSSSRSEEIDSNHIAMGLIILANSISGYHHLSRISWPVIPPMVRAPFANYLPDYIVTNRNVWSEGFGGVLAAGFWDTTWKFDERQGYIDSRFV